MLRIRGTSVVKVVVVGAGIIGLCTAWSLHRRGCEVAMLTAGEPGQGASGVNAGWVVPALSGPVPGPGVLTGSLRWMLNPASPFYVRPRLSPSFLRWLLAFRAHCNRRDYLAGLEAMAALNRDTMRLYDEFEADGLVEHEERSGLLMAFHSQRDHDHDLAGLDWLGRFGFPQPVLGRPQEFEPALGDRAAAAFLLPGERNVNPAAVSAALVGRLRAGGVEIRTNATVRSLEVDAGGRATLRLAEGPVSADAVVVAAGAWTPGLVGSLGARLPVIAGKGYALDFAPAPVTLRQSLYLHEDRVALTPYEGRLRLSGTMELTGLDESISRRRTQAIARAGSGALRDWPHEAKPTRIVSGLRPLTPDGLPVIGRLPRTPTVYVATGHSMLGMTLGPATGAALASLIAGDTVDVLRPFDPARFA
jgi:D-amino-acid dehydrogenase